MSHCMADMNTLRSLASWTGSRTAHLKLFITGDEFSGGEVVKCISDQNLFTHREHFFTVFLKKTKKNPQ